MHGKGFHHEHDKHLNLKLAQHANLEDIEMFRQSLHLVTMLSTHKNRSCLSNAIEQCG